MNFRIIMQHLITIPLLHQTSIKLLTGHYIEL